MFGKAHSITRKTLWSDESLVAKSKIRLALRLVWFRDRSEIGVKSCPKCSGSLEVIYDYEKLRNDYSGIPTISGAEGIWKYSPILPIDSGTALISLGEGSTPYHQLKKTSTALDFEGLFIKDESRNPTCSFKDRKSAAAITKALEQGFKKVTAATAGNAGSSVLRLPQKRGSPHTFLHLRESLPQN